MTTKRTYSAEETKKIGGILAKKILALHPGKKAVIIGLLGDLGSGKTTFVQGFLKVAGWKKRITSPTFVLMRRYPLRGKKFKNIYHLDAYRLKSSEIHHLELEDTIKDPQNIVLVEWPENIKGKKWEGIKIRFAHGKKENERTIRLT